MTRTDFGAGVWFLLITLLANRAGSQEFRLDFNATDELTCEQSDGSFRVVSTLSGSANGSGPDAWSIAVKAPGRPFKRVTLEGTAAESASNEGFVYNEITTGAGNEGLVSIVALSLGAQRSLPATFFPQSILAFDVEGAVGERIQLEYAGELQSTAGPVRNVFKVKARPFLPALNSGVVSLAPRPQLGFALANVDSPVPFEDVIGGRDVRGVVDVFGAAGAATETRVFACVVTELEDPGMTVQGWSLCVGLDGDAGIKRASVRGTAAEQHFSGGFNKTEIVDPAKNSGARGVVTVSFPGDFLGGDEMIPRVGTYSIVEITLEADSGACGGTCASRLSYRDGLRGSGQPIQNNITIAGRSVIPCNVSLASATIRVSEARHPFQRGNVNGDGSVDVSDVAYLLNSLFAGGPESRCREATDVNNDGLVDITDPVFIFRYLFLGSEPPPAPFPECGSFTGDARFLGCFESPRDCA